MSLSAALLPEVDHEMSGTRKPWREPERTSRAELLEHFARHRTVRRALPDAPVAGPYGPSADEK